MYVLDCEKNHGNVFEDLEHKINLHEVRKNVEHELARKILLEHCCLKCSKFLINNALVK